jgi:hypothetical protein
MLKKQPLFNQLGGRMMPRFMAFGVLILAAALSAGASMEVGAASKRAAAPTTTRKVIYEKADSGYRLKAVEAPVPTPVARQALVHMRRCRPPDSRPTAR